MKKKEIIKCFKKELKIATKKFKRFHNSHEGIAVVEEEFEELKNEVFHGTRKKSKIECIQLGAMCMRFLRDLKL